MFKICVNCKVLKSLSDYRTISSRKRCSPYLYSYCTDCVRLLNREQYKKHKVKWGISAKKYYSAYKPRKRIVAEIWRKNNLAYFSCKEACRRAKKSKAMPKWLNKNQIANIKLYYKTAKKWSLGFQQEFHIDHIIPLNGSNVCGLHVPWNLQIMVAEVNLQKGNRYV